MFFFPSSFQSKSEAHRIIDNLKHQKKFDPDNFNARRLIQYDCYRSVAEKEKWVDSNAFIAGSSQYGTSSSKPKYGSVQPGTSMLMSARTINSKASGGPIRFPSIDDEISKGSSPRLLNEPHNSIDPIGKRGLGKQEPVELMKKTF